MVWEVLEILPRLKNTVYRFYDRFWYLEKLIGIEPIKVAELPVNDLLPPEKKNKVIYMSSYRIKDDELKTYEDKLASFLAATQ